MNRFTKTLALAAMGAVALLSSASAQVTATWPSPNFRNLLDNSNFNTYQRSTATVTGITSTATYHADRWAAYGGGSSSVTLVNVTAAVPLPFTNAERLQRASSNANTAAIYLVQEVPSADSTPMAGQTVTLSLWAKADANFSAASSAMTVQVSSGTGADEGLATLISGWTGVLTPLSTTQVITTTWTRYSFTFTVGATATELAVQLGFTPVGTASTTDGIEVTGVQLEQGAGTAYEWKPLGYELPKLLRHYYQINESATAATVRGTCISSTTSISNCFVGFPVLMRVVPTMSYTTGFLGSAQAASTSGFACTGLTTSATVTGFGVSQTGVLIDCASSAGGPAAGVAGWFWDAGTGTPGGRIKASADF